MQLFPLKLTEGLLMGTPNHVIVFQSKPSSISDGSMCLNTAMKQNI